MTESGCIVFLVSRDNSSIKAASSGGLWFSLGAVNRGAGQGPRHLSWYNSGSRGGGLGMKGRTVPALPAVDPLCPLACKRDRAAWPALTPCRDVPVPTWPCWTPDLQLLGRNLCCEPGGHTAVVRPTSPWAAGWGDGTPYSGDMVCSTGLKAIPGRTGNWRSLKLAAFPWCRRRSRGGGFTQARGKPAGRSERGCAGAVGHCEAGGRRPVGPTKMAAARAAGATWATAAAGAAAGPAGVLHGGSGGWL